MFYKIIYNIVNVTCKLCSKYTKSQLGYCGKNVRLGFSIHIGHPERVFLHDNTNIYKDFKFISYTGKFIMKENSGSAQGLTVITGNHGREVCSFFKDNMAKRDLDQEHDIIVEEDVWIGANVTLLSGAYIGRGASIGAGAVVRSNIPPYSVVVGNPSKVVGFNFTPEEIIVHEKALYPEDQRLPLELLEKNYKKYFLDHIKEIKAYTSLICK